MVYNIELGKYFAINFRLIDITIIPESQGFYQRTTGNFFGQVKFVDLQTVVPQDL